MALRAVEAAKIQINEYGGLGLVTEVVRHEKGYFCFSHDAKRFAEHEAA